MTIIVIINAQNKYATHAIIATKFDIDLDNVIILPTYKFGDTDPHGTAAMFEFT